MRLVHPRAVSPLSRSNIHLTECLSLFSSVGYYRSLTEVGFTVRGVTGSAHDKILDKLFCWD